MEPHLLAWCVCASDLQTSTSDTSWACLWKMYSQTLRCSTATRPPMCLHNEHGDNLDGSWNVTAWWLFLEPGQTTVPTSSATERQTPAGFFHQKERSTEVGTPWWGLRLDCSFYGSQLQCAAAESWLLIKTQQFVPHGHCCRRQFYKQWIFLCHSTGT